MNFDWTIVEKIGMGGIAFLLIFFGNKILMFLLHQWKASTDALNRNTEGYKQLSKIFEQTSEREIKFQQESLLLMKDTNSKVDELHRKIIKK